VEREFDFGFKAEVFAKARARALEGVRKLVAHRELLATFVMPQAGETAGIAVWTGAADTGSELLANPGDHDKFSVYFCSDRASRRWLWILQLRLIQGLGPGSRPGKLRCIRLIERTLERLPRSLDTRAA